MKKKIAEKISGVGPYTFVLLWDKIPEELKNKLTGKELGVVIRLAYFQHQEGLNYDKDQ